MDKFGIAVCARHNHRKFGHIVPTRISIRFVCIEQQRKKKRIRIMHTSSSEKVWPIDKWTLNEKKSFDSNIQFV